MKQTALKRMHCAWRFSSDRNSFRGWRFAALTALVIALWIPTNCLAGYPPVEADPYGNVFIAALGPNGSLIVYNAAADNGPWNQVTIAGSNTTFSEPALAVRSTGEVDVVAEGPGNSLVYYWNTTPLNPSSWYSETIGAAGTTYSTPAIAVRKVDPAGEIDIVAMGLNNSLIYYWATPGSPWSSRTIAGPGTTFSAPAIAIRTFVPPRSFLTISEADVVALGPDNSLRLYWATPSSPWSSTTVAGPGNAFSEPAIAVRSTNPGPEADIVVVGPNNSVYYYWGSPGSSSWSSTTWSSTAIAGYWTTYLPASIAVRDTGEADVVFVGPSRVLEYYWAFPGGSWSSTTLSFSYMTWSTPAISVRSSGEVDVATIGPSNSLLLYAAPFGSWIAYSTTTVAGPGTTF